jgi:16S rRNA (cytosine1402-N4)-methyltransferase
MEQFTHESVMLNETLEAIRPRSGGVYADATAGGGGHSQAILDASAPSGRLVAVDRDPRAVEQVRQRLASYGDRALVVHGAYSELGTILKGCGAERVDGLIADLGVSSPQLDVAERGFSFHSDGPLDMRMDTTSGQSLAELLADIDDRSLADILYHYGEERRSRPIARSILRARDQGELSSTFELRRAVLRASGPRSGRIDPATRSFQALRIAVNGELEQLQALLRGVPDWLDDGGVAAIISFHSLEDRLVKHAFRDEPRLEPLHRRPLRPSPEEERENPRSRSAKLRAARRLPRDRDEEVER